MKAVKLSDHLCAWPMVSSPRRTRNRWLGGGCSPVCLGRVERPGSLRSSPLLKGVERSDDSTIVDRSEGAVWVRYPGIQRDGGIGINHLDAAVGNRGGLCRRSEWKVQGPEVVPWVAQLRRSRRNTSPWHRPIDFRPSLLQGTFSLVWTTNIVESRCSCWAAPRYSAGASLPDRLGPPEHLSDVLTTGLVAPTTPPLSPPQTIQGEPISVPPLLSQSLASARLP